MEKFSVYNDPLSGVNPFVARRPAHSFTAYIWALVKAPLVLLMFLSGLNPVCLLTSIRSSIQPGLLRPRIVAANASSFLDMYVLRHLTGIRNFYYVAEHGFVDVWSGSVCQRPAEPCVVFPEGCRTNNRGVLQFVRDVQVDHVCGIRYSGPCGDASLQSLLDILASGCSVAVEIKRSTRLKDICELSGLPQVRWTLSDRNEFVRRFNKQC